VDHVVDLALRQHGLITRAQARALGVTDRMIGRRVESGWLERVEVGVFRVGAAPGTWRQRVMAAVLAAGPGAAASHLTAAALLGFEGARPGVVHVSTTRWTRRLRSAGAAVHESQDLLSSDILSIDGIPTTKPVRTLIDSGCLVGAVTLETWLDQCIREGRASIARVEKRRRDVARPGRNGVGPMGLLLRERVRRQRVTHSGFEVRLSRLLEDHGLPRPVRQFRVHDAGGRFVAQVDLAYPSLRTVLEADSLSWHANRRSFDGDRARWNRIKAAGYEVLVYTWQHVHRDPHHVLSTTRDVLDRQAQILGHDPRELRQICTVEVQD
jgi:very-short-patch-repair endonuclease